MTGVTVRLARPEDAAGVLAVQGEAAAERSLIATQPEDLRTVEQEATLIRTRTPESGFLLVAEDAGRVVGICGVRLGDRAATRHLGELGLTVAASHRGRGVGRLLMEAAHERSRAAGVRKMCLNVFADNERARRLYRRLGYEEEGLRRAQYHVGGAWKDEVLMAKWLEAP